MSHTKELLPAIFVKQTFLEKYIMWWNYQLQVMAIIEN